MTEAPRWRIGVEVRSPDVGAAAAFADAVDYDDVQPFPVPGLVLVLGSRKSRHVVLDLGDVPPGLPVLDRYSGERVPEGDDHPETAPIKPFIYAPEDFEPPSV